jgi:(p)ppGpp synthase/HD superfamily hydrolase
MLERAIEIAVEAHKGQVDKGGSPYILHPLRVMMSVNGESEKIVAVLHDVVEDSVWTFDALLAEGFAVEAISIKSSRPSFKITSEKKQTEGFE